MKHFVAALIACAALSTPAAAEDLTVALGEDVYEREGDSLHDALTFVACHRGPAITLVYSESTALRGYGASVRLAQGDMLRIIDPEGYHQTATLVAIDPDCRATFRW